VTILARFLGPKSGVLAGLWPSYTETMTERQPYQVLETFRDFEIRSYPAGVQIETEVRGDFLRAGNMGFGPLVRFISGNNKKRQSIAMTAPVIQQASGIDTHRVRFVLPEAMSASDTPQALDPSVRILEVPAHFAAARKFSGSWSEERFEGEGKALISALLTQGITSEGSLYFARFDPPWKPGFLKRNEVLIKIKR
jgi:hypothetical protein